MAKRKTGIPDDPATPEDESVEEVAESEEGAEEQPDPEKHILVDGGATGSYELRPQPKGWNRDRALNIDGANVEHVGDHPSGVWQYRKM